MYTHAFAELQSARYQEEARSLLIVRFWNPLRPNAKTNMVGWWHDRNLSNLENLPRR